MSERLNLERLAIAAAARMEGDVSSLRTQLARCDAAYEAHRKALADLCQAIDLGWPSADWARRDLDGWMGSRFPMPLLIQDRLAKARHVLEGEPDLSANAKNPPSWWLADNEGDGG